MGYVSIMARIFYSYIVIFSLRKGRYLCARARERSSVSKVVGIEPYQRNR
ncbi:hypothetical protein HanRHA438_Chr16g0763261 [Helianthus annuus]|nr:hypothetical protein HanIR_Chr16g0816521 [Helianthus annuus]KAJ0836122.1 hypothetical protein HanRHA438_Chr16g0763261 [Helianthus annuus]